ncbi:MAG TPA: aminoacyl-tRNA hydrolase, partial [Spirochaetes bacterium]|nr:aminoacyl-tRNA hydrolase [Spirochaetota bacterium]
CDYVLGNFPSSEKEVLEQELKKVVDALGVVITDSITSAMNQYNNK